jgi:hypothetical protein
MREKMAAIESQIEVFVSALNEQLSTRIPRPERQKMSALIPVINLSASSAKTRSGRER